MTISQVSEKYNITADTLRYYEKIGLIHGINKEKNGIRNYTEFDCNFIEFVVCMRSSGMSIESLLKYIKLLDKGDSSIKERKEILVEQRDEMVKKRDNIDKTIDRLNTKIQNYDSKLINVEKNLKKGEDKN